MSIKIQNIKKSSGFTLLEVMIALVIFSIGMLGLAGIQAIALQNNNTAYMRTIAMQQAYNIADLIRASTDFDGDVTSAFNAVDTTLGTEPTACIVNDQLTNCTADQIAAFDIFHWKNRLNEELPSGRGKITLSSDVYEIIIMWDEKKTGVTGEGCSGDSDIDLKCYTLHIQV
ncbi:MAG: type IV pilus modification protein PilV [Gammaproteobacteria bacterium]|nr:type IV pilus modification protein PilV [Gammaproteobacteria bacterium]